MFEIFLKQSSNSGILEQYINFNINLCILRHWNQNCPMIKCMCFMMNVIFNEESKLVSQDLVFINSNIKHPFYLFKQINFKY